MQRPAHHEKRRQEAHTSSARPFWIYGNHAVKAALLNERRKVRRLVAAPQALEKLAGCWKARGMNPENFAMNDIAKLLPEGAVHQGVALEVMPLELVTLEGYLASAKEKRTLLLLDQVTDPHNVGAILRSAAAFGAGAVILPRQIMRPTSRRRLVKASSGGIEIVPLIYVTNLAQCMETLKKQGYWCAGLDGEATQLLAEAKLAAATALVLGAEGAGLRRLTAERCDLLVRLPISSQMESLNVSNAAAVALYALAQS